MKNLLFLYTYKFFKNPLNTIFSIVFPIAWIIISYFSWGRGEDTGINGFDQKTNYFTFSVSGYLLLSATSISLMNIPNVIANDRIHNRVKVFRTFNITKYEYLTVHCLVNFLIFFLVFTTQLLISNFGFGLNLKPTAFFQIFFLDLLAFIFMLPLAIFLSNFGSTDRTVILISLLVFYPILFLSGNFIPTYSIDRNNVWFKYVQFLSPIGSAAYFSQNILLHSIFQKSQLNFNFDFLGILIPVFEAIIFSFLGFKYFRWK